MKDEHTLKKHSDSVAPASCRHLKQPGRGRRCDVTEHALVPYLLLCAAPVIWGLSGVLVRWADLPGKEYVLIFWRSVFALAFYAAFALLRDRRVFRPGSGFLLLAASGLCTAAYTICAFKAYNLISIGTATFIIYLAPVFVALLAPLVLKEKLERSTVLCLAIALGGTALMSVGQRGGGGSSWWAGALLALAGAVLWAVMMLIWKKLRDTHSPLTIGIWTHGICALIYMPLAVPATGSLEAKGWASVAVFGVVVIGGAGLIYLYAVKRVKAQDAALLAYIEPVSAMVLGLTLLGEVPNWQDFAGAVLIIVAGFLLLRLRTGAAEEVAEVFDAAER